MRLLFLFILFVLTASPAFARTHPWQITLGENHLTVFELPTTDYELSRTYYDTATKRFLLHFIIRGNTITHSFFSIDPTIRKGEWIAVTPETLSAKTVFALPPSGTSMFMNSQLLRSTRAQTVQQPFGQYEVVLRQAENSYKRKTSITRGQSVGEMEQTFGYGDVYLEIRDEKREKIVRLQANYNDNSDDYAAYWSPDGRALLIILPDATIAVGGPYPTDILDMLLQSKLDTQHALDQNDVERDDRAAAGLITPEERYGRPYSNLVYKLDHCAGVLWTTGNLKSLTLRNPGGAFDFGYPKPVGKRLVFDYVAEKGSGQLTANIVTYGSVQASFAGYRDWLETVMIADNIKGKSYAKCP